MKSKSITNQSNFCKQFHLIKERNGMREFIHNKNNLRVLHLERPDTKTVTCNIVYRVGSVHEKTGETGLAHMLEHMLFKPTLRDQKSRKEASIMALERNHGVLVNASTWKDRTNYYCVAPTIYLNQILEIEADRLTNVVLNEKALAPERATVVSEFDMYFSKPSFALDREISAAAFMSHPYRHETIGWREDIINYTAKKLQLFYKQHYHTGKATIIVIGDINVQDTLSLVNKHFGHLKDTSTLPEYEHYHEPIQTGRRHVEISRKSNQHILSLNIKCPAFSEPFWNQWYVFLKMLADGPDSFLQRYFVDTGKAVSVDSSITPTKYPFLATLNIILPDASHKQIHTDVLSYIATLKKAELTKSLQRTMAQIRYLEPFQRTSSQDIASELTEYIASENWEMWHDSLTMIANISVDDILLLRDLFLDETKMTSGYFIGT